MKTKDSLYLRIFGRKTHPNSVRNPKCVDFENTNHCFQQLFNIST